MEENVMSTAAQVIISIVPIVGIVFGGILVFFYILWHHREVKLEIKTGTFVPRKINLKAFSLLAGLLLTGVGTILSLVFAIIDGFSYTILGGLLPAIIGVAFLVFYRIYPDFKKSNENDEVLNSSKQTENKKE